MGMLPELPTHFLNIEGLSQIFVEFGVTVLVLESLAAIFRYIYGRCIESWQKARCNHIKFAQMVYRINLKIGKKICREANEISSKMVDVAMLEFHRSLKKFSNGGIVD
ncbi:hypothetical protein INH39_11135 [Massilia violaceinigra]|uniref:Uncharacterized protein n=1 Tax=Massilia violaceinigra TaxID=2045208 RepID=A0ABY4ABJ9_9BURK|nr:hypothetical protein [Massilia violaceinigra]UOD32166.1 hypothetical protein INH39_11135 [Massilia violaceinigra]